MFFERIRKGISLVALLLCLSLLLLACDRADIDTQTPTADPTENVTSLPTEGATLLPTEAPTSAPTEAPTSAPTEQPTNAPTEAPTSAPTEQPTNAPTEAPTSAPTEQPTNAPTEAPTSAPTEQPTNAPTEVPTSAPTEAPTDAPTEAPTDAPTEAPTDAPTEAPTNAPTEAPTDAPTEAPTTAPTEAPTNAPTEAPTDAPTEAPTEKPTEPPCRHEYDNGCDTDCNLCGDIRETQHNETVIDGKLASCTETGLTYSKRCTVCGVITLEASVIDALGHNEIPHAGLEPTCTSDGYKPYVTCSRCEYSTYEKIETTGHVEKLLPGVEATCTEPGLTDGIMCTVCGDFLVAQEEIPMLDHTEQLVPEVAATCTAGGLTQGIRCSICQTTLLQQQSTDPLGHTEEIIEAVQPTCTDAGLTAGKKCKTCGEITEKQSEIPATGHVEEIISAIAPNCMEKGLTEGKVCRICKEVLIKRAEIPALGHTEIIDEAIAADCENAGLTEGKHCSVCGEVLVAQKTVVATGHSYSPTYEADEKGHWRTCENCSDKVERSHSFSNGICGICGYEVDQIKHLEMSDSGDYAQKGHAFDYVMLDGEVIASAGTSPSAANISTVSIKNGQEIRLQGWVGFKSHSIDSFGLYFDGDIHNATVVDAFKSEPEGPVITAGGEYRFSIFKATDGLRGGNHTVSFVAILEDGTYIVMKTLTLEVEASNIVEIPDDEIIKAEKEELLEDTNMIMIPTENSGEYKTPAGLVFVAAGEGMTYDEDLGTFEIGADGLKINITDFEDRFSNSFNRYKIAYSSSAPLKVTVTYADNGQAVTDEIFLEAGERMLFNCLTLGYLDGLYAKHISSLDIQVLDAEQATFSLYSINTENAPVIGDGLTYLENSRYRLGVKLAWGGGISYILDKQDGNDALGNIINNADTGRLVQQSYYGTNSTSEYSPGSYGGNAWNYNPVQGGNLHNQPSRIIDVTVKEGSIYIKAQPRDWAKTELTPSYMENVYTIYSDRIQVDNRFVDFAGFKTNPARHQELPAFYTVGYLNTFKFYNGRSPWTGDTLTEEDSLAFWAGNSNAYFKLKKGNTETWCAWVNKDADYGIGLYTPNIDILLAGRHGYEADPDTTNPASGACSYVAPLNSFKIVSYKPLEYSYLIGCGSTEEIRDLFEKYKDFSDNAALTSPDFSYVSNRVRG